MFNSQVNVDTSFAHAYSLYGYGDHYKDEQWKLICHKHTYNMQCNYCPNSSICFAQFKYLNSHWVFVCNVKCGVLDMHMRGHNKENCGEQYSLPYHWCNAHNHGEGIEQPWIKSNQTAIYTQQMKDAHCKDSIICQNNNWNHKKFINQCGYSLQLQACTVVI